MVMASTASDSPCVMRVEWFRRCRGSSKWWRKCMMSAAVSYTVWKRNYESQLFPFRERTPCCRKAFPPNALMSQKISNSRLWNSRDYKVIKKKKEGRSTCTNENQGKWRDVNRNGAAEFLVTFQEKHFGIIKLEMCQIQLWRGLVRYASLPTTLHTEIHKILPLFGM
jgi:hypothetical protein